MHSRFYKFMGSGLLLAALTASPALAWPDEAEKPSDKPSDKSAEKKDLGAILEKLPPEIRERVKAELERVREETNQIRREAAERGERLLDEATAKANELRRSAEKELDQLIRQQAEAQEKARAGKPELPPVPSKPKEAGKERHEVRVEVRKEGDAKPEVHVFRDGQPVSPLIFGIGASEFPANGMLYGYVDLSKFPPEKRAEIEKARAEFKRAVGHLREAEANLAKAEGRELGQVMIFRRDGRGMPGGVVPPGLPPIGVIPGDRLPNIPLPPGAMGDRLPLAPIQRQGPGPELENRVSKAEKALDDILGELKKLREKSEDDDDDDDDDDKKEKKRR